MGKTLKEIARAVGGKIVGDENIIITGVCGIKEAQPGDITFLANPKYNQFIDKTQASAVIAAKGAESTSKTIVQVENPSLAFTKVIAMFIPDAIKHPAGISDKAVVSKTARIGKNAAISHYAVIEENSQIAEGVIIYPNCYIGSNVKIGANTVIYSNVTIREGSTIGENVIIHSGTVIGSDGFGYIEINGTQHKIPQVGIVVIEDDVEIGANVAIARARFGKTVIGKGTKIDNLVQIAHNVKIGPGSIIVAQAGISGSTTIGKNAILAGQAGLVGHIELGDNVIVGAQAGVTKSFSKDTILLGSPARPISEQKKLFAYIDRLPELFAAFKKIKDKVLTSNGKAENDKNTG
ncbi:MAG: UDP-3-O-(3-hydroxymyristoyl)glucosamine N-acyltransferase [Candidatus Omnitrophica bacterium]|nr:UDP-3-O-(3-hydroxymyristoyl)glucosamine N-acyltransferase [Candidatus Omnitrophota bacterium]